MNDKQDPPRVQERRQDQLPWYNEHLSKSERSGKTGQEIMTARMMKYMARKKQERESRAQVEQTETAKPMTTQEGAVSL